MPDETNFVGPQPPGPGDPVGPTVKRDDTTPSHEPSADALKAAQERVQQRTQELGRKFGRT